MRYRCLTLAVVVALGLWGAGCDTGKGANPKAENPNNVQLKPLESPQTPGGGGDKKAGGGSQGPNAQ
ncbi:MAG TPA: hypothetical protein VKE40_17670 [Gemmataceae bacterium]|nr:hypothetical protein [Gemmataceae bacterium]